MSAFMLSKADIDALVTASIRLSGGRAVQTAKRATAMGQALIRANAQSIAYNYPRDGVDIEALVTAYEYAPIAFPAGPLSLATLVKILKLVRCYVYQSGDPPTWEASTAREICDAIVATAIHELPGYSDAPWGLGDDRDAFTRAS